MQTRMKLRVSLLPLFFVLFILAAAHVAGAADGKQVVQVFILAGQSNMEGQGVVSMDHPKYYNGGKGNLVWSMANSQSRDLMKHLKDEQGNWVVRDDVQISFKAKDVVRKGGLTIGYTGYGGSSHIGPELQFGNVVGDYFEQPVLLIKTAWGGKSLYKDFRPPSSGGQVGPYYTQMIEEVRDALKAIGDQPYETRGFIWMQGWNDMCTPQAIPEYADNLVALAKDIRKEFNSPDLPFVVGELGNGGVAKPGSSMQQFREAQKSGTERIKNAVFVTTHDFARPAELSPNTGHGHHWFGNAERYFLVGDALGKAMVRMLGFYGYSANLLGGDPISLDRYRGKVVLVVNTASKCGLTPQYEGLEALYKKYKDKGLEIIGFPCNQFGKQEPGTASQIQQFCQQNYGVTFTMFDKIEVNGDNAHPLYKWLKNQLPSDDGTQNIKWNFNKFLIDRNGHPVKRFEPRTKPAALAGEIEKLLAQ